MLAIEVIAADLSAVSAPVKAPVLGSRGRPVAPAAAGVLAVMVVALLLAPCLAAWSETPAVTLPQGVDLNKPLSLVDAVRVAIANSPRLPIATETAKRAEASAVQARAAKLPELTAGYDWATGETAAARHRSTSHTLALELNQTFYQSGLKESIRAAEESAKVSWHGVADTQRQLILDVATDYYAAQAALAYVQVSRRSVMSSRQHLDAVEARIEQELAAKADRYAFDVELAQAQVQAISAENQAEVALNALKTVMGLPADQPLQLADTLGRPVKPERLPDLVAQAYAARPDIRQLEGQVEVARQNLRIAQINRRPVVSAGGSAGYGDYNGDTDDKWQVQVGVSLPLYDGDFTRAKENSARSALTIAEENLRQAKIEISAEVERSYRNAILSDARIDAADAAAKSAQTSLDAAQGKYLEGLANVVEVTDAELRLREADVALVQAQYDYNSALAALRAALGQAAAPGTEKLITGSPAPASK
ncbi:TolC family protein [bacterium]|nr:TolC family protein [bacterium]